MKVKTFKLGNYDNIDETINDWIESLPTDIHITSISTSVRQYEYFICLSYDEYKVPQFDKFKEST